MSNRKILKMLRPVIEFIEFRVIHIDDSPERIAGGVFAGIFIAYTPFLGLHIFIGLFAAFLFKINKFATLSFVWISNVFTLIPIYYPSYLIGRRLINIFYETQPMSKTEIMHCFRNIFTDMALNNVFSREFWSSFISLLTRIGPELLVGGIFTGLPMAALGYYLTFKIITRHRKRVERAQKTAITDTI